VAAVGDCLVLLIKNSVVQIGCVNGWLLNCGRGEGRRRNVPTQATYETCPAQR